MDTSPEEKKKRNWRFTRARKRLESLRDPGAMSREEFADECNKWLASKSIPDKTITANTIAKIEQGKVTWPGLWRRRAYRAITGATTDAELGLYDKRRGEEPVFLADEADTDMGLLHVGARSAAEAVQQRSCLQQDPIRTSSVAGGSAVIRPGSFAEPVAEAYVAVVRSIMSAARIASEHAMDAGARAVSDVTVEQLGDDAARIARDFPQMTPAHAVEETLRVRDLAVSLLDRTRRPAQQRDLYLVTAQAAALLASESVDLGLWPSAMEAARAAYTYGEIIGHDGVRAYARGMQATVAYWTGRPGDAVRYAEAAVEFAPPGVARVRALSVLARAWSHRGAHDEVGNAIAAADDARADDGDDDLHDTIGGEFGFGISQQARCASTAWLQVNQVDKAASAASRALSFATEAAQSGAPWSTIEAEARVDLATCQLLAGQLDGAEDTLAPLWAMPADWRRAGLVGRLNKVNTLLAEDTWRNVSGAAQLVALTGSFTQSTGGPALPSA